DPSAAMAIAFARMNFDRLDFDRDGRISVNDIGRALANSDRYGPGLQRLNREFERIARYTHSSSAEPVPLEQLSIGSREIANFTIYRNLEAKAGYNPDVKRFWNEDMTADLFTTIEEMRR